jgi:hypothetical protein
VQEKNEKTLIFSFTFDTQCAMISYVMNATRYHFTVRRSGNTTLSQFENTANGKTSNLSSCKMDEAEFAAWLKHTRSNGHTVEVKVNGQPAFAA